MDYSKTVAVPETGLPGEEQSIPEAGMGYVLIPEERIQERIAYLAKDIAMDFQQVHAIVVMKGAVMFFEDLRRALEELGISITFDPVTVRSYAGTQSTGKIKVLQEVEDIAGEDLLLVEDIVDTGLTVKFLKKHLLQKGAKSVKICTLLEKPTKRKHKIRLDYVGFTIPDVFVVGYGMDYEEQYRELTYVGVLKTTEKE